MRPRTFLREHRLAIVVALGCWCSRPARHRSAGGAAAVRAARMSSSTGCRSAPTFRRRSRSRRTAPSGSASISRMRSASCATASSNASSRAHAASSRSVLQWIPAAGPGSRTSPRSRSSLSPRPARSSPSGSARRSRAWAGWPLRRTARSGSPKARRTASRDCTTANCAPRIDAARGGPYGVAVAPDGAVWATLQTGNALLRIAPDGKMTEHEIPSPSVSPTDVAVDATGAVWFLEFRTDRIGRFAKGSSRNARSRRTRPDSPDSRSLRTVRSGSGCFAKAASGGSRTAIWSSSSCRESDARPYSVAVDRAGNVWYADISGYVGMLPAAQAAK